MSDRQQRWEELQARWACGERLSEDEQRERLDYAAFDQTAQRELQLFAELRSRASGEGEPVPAAMIDSVLDAVRARPHLRLVTARDRGAGVKLTPQRRVWLQRALVSAAALSFVVALLAIVFVSRPAKAPRPTALATSTESPLTVPRARAELVLAAGEVRVGDRSAGVDRIPLREGQYVTTGDGRACLTIEPTVDVCLAGNSTVQLQSLGAQSVRLRVESGTALASLSRRAPGSSFALVMGDMSAEAHGTTFAVRSDGVEREVTVLEGTVDVIRGDGPPARVHAHARALVSSTTGALQQARLNQDEEARLLGLSSWQQLRTGTSVGVLQLFAAPSAVLRASVDDEAPLPLPLQALVRSGKRRVTWRDAAGVETSSWIELAAGETRRVEAPPRPATQGEPAPVQSPAALLEQARRELGRAKPGEALALYEKLRAAYPGSVEAHTVLVTMGKLELSLGRQARALRHFDSYLRHGGVLAPEALAGKIRALRALGRSAEERAAIQQYLTRYPTGLEVPAFEQRLQDLGRP